MLEILESIHKVLHAKKTVDKGGSAENAAETETICCSVFNGMLLGSRCV
jgi:hypothetical protein